MFEAAHDLQFPQVVEVASPIEGARGKVLHVLMDEDARNLVFMVKEMLLFRKNGFRCWVLIRRKLPDNDVS